MKLAIKNDFDWVAKSQPNDLIGIRLISSGLAIAGITLALIYFLLPLAFVGLLPIIHELLRKGNIPLRLGARNVISGKDFYGRAVYNYQSTNRYKLWNKYHHVHPQVRADMGVLTLADIKDIPEAEANRLYQMLDNLETAYWEYKQAVPDPRVQAALENAAAQTKTYKEMTQHMKELSA